MKKTIYLSIFFTFLFLFLKEKKAISSKGIELSEKLPIYHLKTHAGFQSFGTGFLINQKIKNEDTKTFLVTTLNTIYSSLIENSDSKHWHNLSALDDLISIQKPKKLSFTNNLAIMEIKLNLTKDSELLFPFSLRDLNENPLTPEEELYVLGYPTNHNEIYSLEKVGPLHSFPDHQLKSFFIKQTAIYNLGKSAKFRGSPVLDHNENVVGMVYGNFENLIFFITADKLKSSILHHHTPPLLNQKLTKMTIKNILNQALQSTLKKAQKNNIEAMFALAILYFKEQNKEAIIQSGLPEFYENLNALWNRKNQKKKFSNNKWFNKAAKAGHILSTFFLGNQQFIHQLTPEKKSYFNMLKSLTPEKKSYFNKFNSLLKNFQSLFFPKDKDPKEKINKINALQEAADLGSGKAMLKLMDLYRTEKNEPRKNLKRAINWALKAIQQDYIAIQNHLERALEKENNSTVFEILKAIDENTNETWVKFSLSTAHFLNKNPITGLQILEELITKDNNSKAQFKLGQIYLYGKYGVKKNLSEALKFFNLSSKNGNLWADLELSRMYFKGNGVPKDLMKALELIGNSLLLINRVPYYNYKTIIETHYPSEEDKSYLIQRFLFLIELRLMELNLLEPIKIRMDETIEELSEFYINLHGKVNPPTKKNQEIEEAVNPDDPLTETNQQMIKTFINDLINQLTQTIVLESFHDQFTLRKVSWSILKKLSKAGIPEAHAALIYSSFYYNDLKEPDFFISSMKKNFLQDYNEQLVPYARSVLQQGFRRTHKELKKIKSMCKKLL